MRRYQDGVFQVELSEGRIEDLVEKFGFFDQNRASLTRVSKLMRVCFGYTLLR